MNCPSQEFSRAKTMDMSELEPSATESIPGDGADETESRSLSRPTMPPAEALEKIHRGETIQGARIVGLKLKGEFPLPVRLRDVTLVEPLLDSATFADEVSFLHCTLDRLKCSRTSKFAKGLSLSGSSLFKPQFRRVEFGGPFYCDNTRCRGKVLFESVRFESRVRFWEASFLGWVEFKACEFVGEADFRSFHADQGFVFTSLRFHADAPF